MPENLKNLLNQDMGQVPLMLGMVVRAKNFVVDKPMITFIGMLMLASSSTGVAIYKLNVAEKTIVQFGKQIEQLTRDNTKLILEISYMRRDMDKITTNLGRHLEGHFSKIVK